MFKSVNVPSETLAYAFTDVAANGKDVQLLSIAIVEEIQKRSKLCKERSV